MNLKMPIPAMFFFFFSSLLRLAVAYDPKTMACEPKGCGNVQDISYPFWLDKQHPSYCGYPDFKLTCMNNTPLLNLPYQKLLVQKIFYANNSMLLTEFIEDDCSIPNSSLSFDGTPFSISPANKELILYYGCSVAPPASFQIPCTSNEIFFRLGGDYMLPQDLGSCKSTILPVSSYASTNKSDFRTFLQNGFLLNWTAHDCSECEASNGVCGYDNGAAGFACICPDRVHLKRCRRSATFVKKIIIGVISGTATFLLACIFLYQCIKRKFHNSIFWKKKTESARACEDFLERYGALTPKTYSYSELKRITKSFSDKLGQGGYGTVFKGTLSDGHQVAVKVLSETKGNGEEFINEVASISRTSHVNIVSLLGFCLEGTKRALVYDFMPNGSLEKYICDEISDSMRSLSWETLYNIAIGIARGLEYLHRGCNTRIVHFDIKPHNILLDEDFCPKISDFGLAKLCPHKESILSMVGARGTIGYIAPEVFSRNFGVVSSKSDVYSYGMMVLEMAGGRKKSSTTVNRNSGFYFPHWIYEHLDKHGTLQDWGMTAQTEEIARKMIFVGLWCIQTMPTNRPSIVRVVEMLSGSITDLHMPPKPYLSSPVSALGSIATSTS